MTGSDPWKAAARTECDRTHMWVQRVERVPAQLVGGAATPVLEHVHVSLTFVLGAQEQRCCSG